MEVDVARSRFTVGKRQILVVGKLQLELIGSAMYLLLELIRNV